MAKSREREIDVDAHLNDPETERIRKQLAELVENADNEMSERGVTEEDDEEAFTPQPEMLRKRAKGGPLASRDQMERVRKVEADLNRKEKAGELPIRRSFDPAVEDDTEKPVKRELVTNAVRPRAAPANAPIDPPDISTIQRLEKRLADQEKELRLLKSRGGIPVAVEEPKQVSRLASRRKLYDAKYNKITPPSNNMFYDFDPDALQVKKIDLTVQTAITNARRTRDISAYIDALDSTLNPDVDLRDFTHEDWFYFLYWHKFNSYNRTPLVLTWMSKYGNENRYSIQETDIKYINPIITPSEYNDYKLAGLRVPTLRDWEILNTPSDLTLEDLEIYSKAQYFEGNTIEEKVDNYFALGETVEILEMIAELKVKTHHGVVDNVDVTDALFDVEDYLKARKNHVLNLEAEAENYVEVNKPLYLSYKEEIKEIVEEIEEKELTLKNGGQVRPEVETHPVRFNALDIFPFL